MSNTNLTQSSVIDTVAEKADIFLERDVFPYLEMVKNQLRTAVLNKDGEGIAAYVVRGLQATLTQKGARFQITPDGLRAVVTKHGWRIFHDAIAGRENAMAVLQRAIEAAQGTSQFGEAGEPRSRHSQPPARQAAPPADANPSQDPRPSPSQQHQGRSERNHGRAESFDGPPPGHPAAGRGSGGRAGGQQGAQRSKPDDNVRTIGSAPSRRQGGRDNRRADAGPADGQERQFDQVKVHGGRAALQFEATTTRRDEETVRLEIARSNGTSDRTYNWSKKLAFQLGTHELQLMCAFLLGYIDGELFFNNHGEANDKWLRMEHQAGQYAGTIKVNMGQGSKDAGTANPDVGGQVQISFMDLGDVISLCMRQCKAQLKFLENEGMEFHSTLRRVAEAYKGAQAAKASRRQGGGQGGGYSGGQQRRAG